ncbi:MAG: glycosyltransferase [Alphaproteobacteria bacterium]
MTKTAGGAARAARDGETAGASRPSDTTGETGYREFQRARRAHWDAVTLGQWVTRGWGGYYHRRLTEIYRFIVTPGQKVLDLGCGDGDLLAALEPSVGVGVDFSDEALKRARERHPHLRFIRADVHELDLGETFDVIILSDLINDLWDVQTVLQRVARHATPRTRVVLNFFSLLWKEPLNAARRLGLASPLLPQNWLTREDVANLLSLAGFEPVRQWEEILVPLGVPLLSRFANRFLVKIPPFHLAALTHVAVARPVPPPPLVATQRPSVSVIVAARNEAGNVDSIFARTPEMGAGTELIFVEGGSKDDTYGAIERAMARHPETRAKLLRQTGTGKGDAVRLGLAEASGDVLMILDADFTVAPEDLPRFYDALVTNKGEFINGVRLVYPMEQQAMRLFNLVGNKFFSLAFSWLLGQPIKDTLCGTKVLWKSEYALIAANRDYFGDFDPFGDFDLIFGAARLDLKIVDLPIRYRARVYGETNIRRWRHGWLLLKMVAFAASRIKFT